MLFAREYFTFGDSMWFSFGEHGCGILALASQLTVSLISLNLGECYLEI